ncbi:MAG: nucleotidyltransferase family protein [Sphingorhabdus sp.]
MTQAAIDAVILAGDRPAGDPLAMTHKVPFKALVRVGGKPMLAHVAERLAGNSAIGRILVLAQESKAFQADRDTEHLAAEPKIKFTESRPTIAASLQAVLTSEETRFPLLITTADNVLLSDAMIGSFLARADGADIAVAVVEREVLMARYPASKRTWIKFRGGQYSGANLFYFGSAKAQRALQAWAEVEQDRKKGWKILTIFGPWLLFLAVARLISVDQFAARVGKKLGLRVSMVKMPQAEACIDVDKQSDLDLVEKILASS